MLISEVRRQLDEVISRAIETGVSVIQNHPVFDGANNSIGDLGATSIALRNVPYSRIYAELETNNQFHIKLPDGGLLIFQYNFDKNGILTKHRLCFFPSPTLPTMDEAPELYLQDNLYADIILERIVRFPVRFDYDPQNYKQRHHPHSHLTLGQFDNCRIPVSKALAPNDFFLFILRNFYFLLHRKNQNKLEKNIGGCLTAPCITPFETAIPYFTIS